MSQLLLDFPKKIHFDAENFMPLPANKAALTVLNALEQKGQGILVVYGQAGTGKSHFLHVAAERLGLTYAYADNLPADPTTQSRWALDELESAQPNHQEALFHLINHVRNNGGMLVVATQTPLKQMDTLLADVHSRLMQADYAELALPAEKDLQMLLLKWSYDRQLTLEPAVTKYLLTRAERSPRALEGMLDKIDAHAMAHKRRITVPLVRDVLQQST